MSRLGSSPLHFVLGVLSILLVALLIVGVWALKSGWVEVGLPVLERPGDAAVASERDPRQTPVADARPLESAAPTFDTSLRGDAPWVMQPAPPPGSRVSTGPLTLEAHGRGDAAIAQIRLQLDDAPLPVTLEQRSQSVWRGQATTSVTPGRHVVQAVVVQADGKTGSYKWSFDAGTPR